MATQYTHDTVQWNMVTTTWAVMIVMALWGWADPATAGPGTAEKGGALVKNDKAPRAMIKTKFGEMEIRFFPDKAPKHVENFIKLAQEGFYDGTIFHRVIPGFMIQGGDPNTKDPDNKSQYGMGGPGYTVNAEFNDIAHKRGIVSMARSQDPNSAGSQFFIVVSD
ncbi:MAG: peptidylprolyl isomerase, partial [bacterium]